MKHRALLLFFSKKRQLVSPSLLGRDGRGSVFLLFKISSKIIRLRNFSNDIKKHYSSIKKNRTIVFIVSILYFYTNIYHQQVSPPLVKKDLLLLYLFTFLPATFLLFQQSSLQPRSPTLAEYRSYRKQHSYHQPSSVLCALPYRQHST